MTQLSEKDHKALMSDMKSFDEQLPCIGIFWYDPESHALCDVHKKELTPGMIDAAAKNDIHYIEYLPSGDVDNDRKEFSILNIEFKQGQTEVRFRYAEREQCLRRLAANSQLSIGYAWSGDMPK